MKDVDQQRGNTADNAAQAYPRRPPVEYVEARRRGGAAALDWSAARAWSFETGVTTLVAGGVNPPPMDEGPVGPPNPACTGCIDGL